MNARYAIQNWQQASFVLVSTNRDIVLMSWPAFQCDIRYRLVRMEGDAVRVIEVGGKSVHKKLSAHTAD